MARRPVSAGPEPQRSEILDPMYKPHFGVSVSALHMEIPGDGNSTRDDLDYTRGYLWQEQAARMGKPLWNTEQLVYRAGIAGLYTMESYSGAREISTRCPR